MNKYLLLAALGSVEACPIRDMMMKMKKHCPESNAPHLDTIQLNRHVMKETYQGFVTGLYQENDGVVPDECFGAWMEAPFYKVKNLHHKMHEDFWSVGVDEVKEVGSDLIDVFYKNTEVCHFERVGDDVKTWCIENPGECIFMENMEGRIFDNMFDIMGKLFDISKMINTNDACYSDLEHMAELHRFMNDIGELAASLSGFDYKWDQSIERKHIKKKAFHTQMKELYMNYQYKNVDPLELMFPDVYEFLKGLEIQIEQFFKDIAKAQKDFAHALMPRHHHAKTHKQSAFHLPELKAPEMKAPEMKMPELKLPEFKNPFDIFAPHHSTHHQSQHHSHAQNHWQHHNIDWSHFKLF